MPDPRNEVTKNSENGKLDPVVAKQSFDQADATAKSDYNLYLEASDRQAKSSAFNDWKKSAATRAEAEDFLQMANTSEKLAEARDTGEWVTMADKPSNRREENLQDKRCVREGISEVNGIEGLDQESWSKLSDAKKQQKLQEVENRLAAVQGRTPEKVHFSEDFKRGENGFYVNPDQEKRTDTKPGIHINPSSLENGPRCVETVAHEGWHANEYRASQVHGSPEAKQFADERATYNTGFGYDRQKMELAAGSYGAAIRSGVYPETRHKDTRLEHHPIATSVDGTKEADLPSSWERHSELRYSKDIDAGQQMSPVRTSKKSELKM